MPTEPPSKAVLDACVLYPTVMREILLGVAGQGLFAPIWSTRILEEWARAVARNIPDAEELARGEVAVCKARWPHAIFDATPNSAVALNLPDPDDVHVLQTAIAISASVIVTMNLKDFPRRTLAEYGVQAIHPDAFLTDLFHQFPDAALGAIKVVHGEAERLSGHEWPIRKLMKKARLPRLGKALEMG